jgi:hypothetical protein
MKTLSIESSWAALDISTRNAQLQISNNLRRRLKITVIRPQMIVDRKLPSFKMNYASRSHKMDSLVHLKQYLQQKNKNKLLDALNKSINNSYALEGLSGDYAAPQNEPVVTLDLSTQASALQTVQELNSSAPKMEWDPGYFKIDWIAGEIKIEWEEINKPDILVSPYSVEIRVKGKKMLKIALNEDKLPCMKGKKVNKGI